MESYRDAVLRAKREHLQQALIESHGNVSKAARLLDLHRTHLHRLLTTLGLHESRVNGASRDAWRELG